MYILQTETNFDLIPIVTFFQLKQSDLGNIVWLLGYTLNVRKKRQIVVLSKKATS